mmetsp:Transcript_129264/g.414390  ORF Transcript_129264/g.414390 Transcript_129264/m.414390 type:complete len:293 (-) Transcript_129264:226-1104(-)
MSVHWSENRVLGDRPVDDDRHTPVDPQQVADPGRVAEDPLADEVVGGREAQHHGVAAAGRVLVPAVAPLVRGAHDVHPVAGAAAAGEAQEAADEGSARELDAMLLEERSDVRHLTEAAPAIGEPLQQVRLHAARQILEGCILLVAEPRNGHEEVLPRGLTELAPEGGAAVEAFGEGGGLRKQLRQRMVGEIRRSRGRALARGRPIDRRPGGLLGAGPAPIQRHLVDNTCGQRSRHGGGCVRHGGTLDSPQHRPPVPQWGVDPRLRPRPWKAPAAMAAAAAQREPKRQQRRQT